MLYAEEIDCIIIQGGVDGNQTTLGDVWYYEFGKV